MVFLHVESWVGLRTEKEHYTKYLAGIKRILPNGFKDRDSIWNLVVGQVI